MAQQIKLYVAQALPEHYIAQDEDGALWLIPCAPVSPAAWEARKPYRGNYTLERVRPTCVERFYQPAAEEPR